MSDVRPVIARWQRRISASTGLAIGVLSAIIAVVFAFGFGGFVIRNSIVRAAFDTDAPVDAGAAWLVAFSAMLAPGLLFTLACGVFVVTMFRTWAASAVFLSLALMVLAVGAALPLRDRNEPPVQPLTEILTRAGASGPAAAAMTDAFWMGLLALAVLLVGAFCWCLALVHAKPPATTTGVLRAYVWIAVAFRWAYPAALVVTVPLLLVAIAANTA